MPEPYEGQPVIKTQVKIVGAGDGLSDAIAVDGRELHMGDEIDVVLGACVVTGVDLRPIDKDDPTGPLVAKLVLRAGKRATVTDDAHVAQLLLDTEARVKAARGEEQLSGTGVGDHDNGPDADTVGRVMAANDATDDEGYYDPEAVDPSTVDV